ncbi:alpha/beta fold hydrolase [Kineococcus indalonis]|uniref:alpha/beta fold hydrolase n=1 Tax=Kineococcus indalonis TaxID=2696566 RepID=UPI0014128598|nr:alpha/beta hydrolase [Kineococcus indalonis]NAZ86128.1 alpha/beta fold hydrolase [Kineococcus indalonis]
MPLLTTAAIDLAFTDTGPAGAPAVLLLHGWPDAARGFSAVAAHLAGAGFRVVAPDLRGAGASVFRSPGTVRDGTAAALVRDALDLADGLGLREFSVVGHDWGARAAYQLAVVAPQRVRCAAALALAHQPRGQFTVPRFELARPFWYQWLMFLDAGVAAVRADPVGFAREQWATWSPPGWWDEAEFAATARAFANPDWTDVTLNAYRTRFLPDEPRDPRYDDVRARVAATARIGVPTLMVQGGADACDPPASSEGLEGSFDSYRRVVLDGVGHFPHREAPQEVSRLLLQHLDAHGR